MTTTTTINHRLLILDVESYASSLFQSRYDRKKHGSHLPSFILFLRNQEYPSLPNQIKSMIIHENIKKRAVLKIKYELVCGRGHCKPP